MERDPAIVLWRDWRQAHAAMERACAEQQRLEARLARTVGYPRVAVPVPGLPGPLYATTSEDIDRLLGAAPETQALRRRLRAALARQRARWDAAVEACGLAGAEARETAAWRRADEVMASLFAVPATSSAGIAAKLAVVVTLGQPAPQDDEFPWPQLRSALADLQRLAEIGGPAGLSDNRS